MKPTFVIQPVSPARANLLTAIHNESFGSEGWSLEQMRGSLALETTRGWVALDNDVGVGFILCQIVSGETEILTFCVRPARQKEKIGFVLLRHALAEIGKAESKAVFLEVAADNHAARKLYENAGFENTGTRPHYYKRGAMTVDAVMYTMTRPSR